MHITRRDGGPGAQADIGATFISASIGGICAFDWLGDGRCVDIIESLRRLLRPERHLVLRILEAQPLTVADILESAGQRPQVAREVAAAPKWCEAEEAPPRERST